MDASRKENGAWINKVNPAHPFNAPKFESAVYKVFQDYNSADDAFSQNEVDVILNAFGYLPHPRENPSPPLYLTNDVSFLVFNPGQETLSDPALRKAIACIKGGLADIYTDDFSNFVLAGPWQNKQTVSRCGLSGAVEILQAASYSWTQKPTSQQAGQGLTLPSGKPFPPITLLVPKPEYDLMRTNDGEYEIRQMQNLGIHITLDLVDPETLHYDVFRSDDYDIAILSWKISEYPGYLCQWFQSPSPFAYHEDKLKSACEILNSTADLEIARQASFAIQSVLMVDLPFIPLDQNTYFDDSRNIKYPFDSVLGGLSRVYGAPSLAIPAP